MVRKVHASVLAAALIAGLAPAAFAQTGMIKGKVVDAEDKPIQGAVITIEFTDGVNRKFEVKSDRRGEFIQIGLAPGGYKVTATAEKIGAQTQQARVRVGATFEANFKLVPGAGGDPAAAAKAAELKKAFDEGVAASKSGNHDQAIE